MCIRDSLINGSKALVVQELLVLVEWRERRNLGVELLHDLGAGDMLHQFGSQLLVVAGGVQNQRVGSNPGSLCLVLQAGDEVPVHAAFRVKGSLVGAGHGNGNIACGELVADVIGRQRCTLLSEEAGGICLLYTSFRWPEYSRETALAAGSFANGTEGFANGKTAACGKEYRP